ncbi:hypothetical protein [Natranaeroarchaeum aerophilus]|uniref:Uncharacterized protein n=1 Tax=Natranaeroarchaeum aerophilus TaxID=2917711 RepID=A0AAE3FSX3_9EURY|nr:hypothetical protein [Natranaeroarchaeum aerophilus]MCL9814551.1 hypothetical protein [Natranaeroarchaeum aerophilus]
MTRSRTNRQKSVERARWGSVAVLPVAALLFYFGATTIPELGWLFAGLLLLIGGVLGTLRSTDVWIQALSTLYLFVGVWLVAVLLLGYTVSLGSA